MSGGLRKYNKLRKTLKETGDLLDIDRELIVLCAVLQEKLREIVWSPLYGCLGISSVIDLSAELIGVGHVVQGCGLERNTLVLAPFVYLCRRYLYSICRFW